MEQKDVTAQAAGQLRAVLAELPPETTKDKAFARRLEGAVIALDSLTATTASEQLR